MEETQKILNSLDNLHQAIAKLPMMVDSFASHVKEGNVDESELILLKIQNYRISLEHNAKAIEKLSEKMKNDVKASNNLDDIKNSIRLVTDPKMADFAKALGHR